MNPSHRKHHSPVIRTRYFRSGSLVHRTGLVAVIASVVAAYLSRWGSFGWHLRGLPGWVYPAAASVGGILFFLAPMVFGNAVIPGGPAPPDLDGRPIILYLRPFEVDLANAVQLLIGASAGIFVALGQRFLPAWPVGVLPLVLNVTREQRLHDALLPIGRLVTFGDPDARLHPVGALRYHAGSDWRERIAGIMDRARLVILRPGERPSIVWEMETVLARVPPDRLVFDLHGAGSRAARRQMYGSLRQAVKRIRRADLPEEPGAARYLVFDAAGVPRLLGEARDPATLLRSFLWSDITHDQLKPVLAAIGVELPDDAPDPIQRASKSFLRGAVYLFVAVLAAALVLLVLMAIGFARRLLPRPFP